MCPLAEDKEGRNERRREREGEKGKGGREKDVSSKPKRREKISWEEWFRFIRKSIHACTVNDGIVWEHLTFDL